MNKFFDPNGLFAQIMNVILGLILVNVVWIICSIPVVTLGASTTALYSVLLRLRDGDDTKMVRRFFAAFGANFKRATAVWLVVLAGIVVCGLDLYFATQMDSGVARVIAGFGLVLVGMVFTFVFILVARYENTWRNHLKNALLIAMGHVPRLLLSWLLWGAAVFLTLYSANTMYVMILMWLMAGVSCLCYANLMIFTPALRKLESVAEETETEE